MKGVLLTLALAITVGGLAQQTPDKENPGSLFKTGYTNPLSDRVARSVGDILTIVIQEQSIADYSAATETSKSDRAGFSPTFIVDIFTRLFRPFSAGATASTKGDGKTSHKMKMDSKMSAVVKQVLANGNLVIEGHRSLTTNKDNQTIVLSGVIRPFDIAADNSILSTKIADAQISMAGKGQIQDRQRKGLINQLLDWLF